MKTIDLAAKTYPPVHYHKKSKRKHIRHRKSDLCCCSCCCKFTKSLESVALFLLLIYLCSHTGPREGATGNAYVWGRDGFGFCHQQWSKSNSGTSESNHSISLEGLFPRDQMRAVNMATYERESTQTNGGWGGWQSVVLPNFLISPTPFLALLSLLLPLLSRRPPCLSVAFSCCDSHLLGKKPTLVLAGNPQHAHCLLTLGSVT